MKLRIESVIWKTRQKKNTYSEQQKEKKRLQKSKDSLRELWNNMKYNNTSIIEIPEGEERERGIESLFGEEENLTGSGNTESPNQDEPKEAYTKIHHN